MAFEEYGPSPITTADADRFVAEQTRVGALKGGELRPSHGVPSQLGS